LYLEKHVQRNWDYIMFIKSPKWILHKHTLKKLWWNDKNSSTNTLIHILDFFPVKSLANLEWAQHVLRFALAVAWWDAKVGTARHKSAIVLGNALIAYRTMYRCIANLSADLDVNIMVSRVCGLRSRKPMKWNLLLA